MSEAPARDGATHPRADVHPGVPTGPGEGSGTGPARRDAASSRPAWLVGTGVLAALLLATAWFAARRGVITDTWPAFLPDTDSTSITRYSGPWLTAAAAAALGAGLSIMAMVRQIVRRSTARPR